MYDDIAPGYNELHVGEQRRKLLLALPLLELLPGMKVADIGCGTAHLAEFFEEQEYTGIDPSYPLLQQAPPRTKVIMARGEELPLEDNSQDVVLSMTALHNYDDFVKGVQELFRIAKDQVVVSILKKSPDHDAIRALVLQYGELVDELDDLHDTIIIIRKT